MPGMKILGIDIETAPNTAFVWGLWKQNVSLSQLIQTGRVMCFGARWYSEDEEDSPIIFSPEVGGRNAHKKMIRLAWSLLDQADVLVHYNGTSFDIPTLNREFVKLGLGPPRPFAEVDLLKTARKRFRFTSNKLAHLLKELGIEEKLDTSGFRLWIGCMDGDPKAWADMEQYNRRDVSSLEKLYRRLLPWVSSHPNHALYQFRRRPICPSCGDDKLTKQGTRKTRTQVYQQYKCGNCGSWSRERFTAVPPASRRNILTS